MDGFYKLSQQQRQLYITQNMVGNSNLYILTFEILFEGNLDCASLCNSIQKVFNQNKILKSQIVDCENTLNLKVKNDEVKIEYIEDAMADTNATSEAEHINLKMDALYKIKLIKKSDQLHLLKCSFHHFLIDGDSIRLFCEELRRTYHEELNTARKENIQVIQKNGWTYFDYITYQDLFRKSNYYREQIYYHRSQFNDQYHYLRFPGKEIRKQTVHDANVKRLIFDMTTFIEMQKYALANKIHISSLFLSGVALLLRGYCNTDDIIIGFISNGRENNIAFKNVLGFFSNILLLRLKLKKDIKLCDFITDVNDKIVKGIANQDYSYGDIVHDMSSYQKYTEKSLIQVIFNMQKTYDLKEQWTGVDKISFQLNKNEQILYGLIVNVEYNNNEVMLKIEYANEIFSETLVNRMMMNYQYILKNTLMNLACLLHDIPCMNHNEHELIMQGFNYTDEEIKHKNIFDILDKSVNDNLNKLAIVDGDMQLTYRDLKRYINSFATVLVNHRTEKEIIAIMLDRSYLYVISLLSVLSINAAFVPIDPSIPNEHKLKMLKDCSVKRIITSKSYDNLIKKLEIKTNETAIIYVDEIEINEVDDKIATIAADDLAYVLFTSGTTGVPKGAMINHENLVNLFLLFKKFFNINHENRILQFANISFDASIWEIFMALYHGAALFIPSKENILDTRDMCQYIDTYQIDTMTLPPVYARQIGNSKLSTIKNLIVAGSVSYDGDYSVLKENINFYNAYGLTETTICATVYDGAKDVPSKNEHELPVGKPAPNTKLFILDNWNKNAPIGVSGDLYISGKCLSSGYINNKKLTQERYLCSEYMDDSVMYLTGDVASWTEDGNIIVTGRNDEQIKIKGIRVELPAIESVYLEHRSIIEFAVIAVESNSDYIIKAFYTADDELEKEELIRYGNAKLPEYMIPRVFTKLAQLPVSHSAKIDKKLLKDLDIRKKQEVAECCAKQGLITEQVYHLIVSLTERRLAVDDNFFEAGLDSYRLLLFKNKLQEKFNVDIRNADLFKYTTINSLSKYLENKLG